MSEKKFKTKIGGQAVMEGVMMRGGDVAAVAVRRPDGEISIKKYELTPLKKKYKILGWPIIRGVINFGEMMVLGYKTLMYSASESGLDAEEAPAEKNAAANSKAAEAAQTAAQTSTQPDGNAEEAAEAGKEKAAEQKDGKESAGESILLVFSAFFGVVIAIALFLVLPVFIVGLLDTFLPIEGFRSAVEGVLKFIIFALYLFLVSRMKEIHRVFEYHGAEHKVISCYEAGDELTPENAAKHTRFHPRCGTSFLFIVLILGIIVASFITWNNLFIRILIKLAMLPLVAGLAYELIMLAGRYDNIFTKIVSAPGLLFQRLTAFEPDLSQLEVSITAFNAVKPEDRESQRW